MVVVDASVAIKWVIAEPGTDQALALLRQALIAPDLLVAECANILWQKVRRGELAAAEAQAAAGLLARADIDLVAMRPLWRRAVALAVRLDRPAYDCVYVALAIERDCACVTADRGLIAAAGRGLTPNPVRALDAVR